MATVAQHKLPRQQTINVKLDKLMKKKINISPKQIAVLKIIFLITIKQEMAYFIAGKPHMLAECQVQKKNTQNAY